MQSVFKLKLVSPKKRFSLKQFLILDDESGVIFVAKRLFVGSLPYDATNAQLEELFAQAGKVESANVITDRYSGQGKGFGFVEMSTDAEAQEAIKKLNGYNMGGRSIVVNEARPREERPQRSFNSGSKRW